jgi:hypothetical protein
MWTTPITDRTQSDVDYIKSLRTSINNLGWDGTSAETKSLWLFGSGLDYILTIDDENLVSSDSLIFTALPISTAQIKGAWNYTDGNRVINNTIWLRDTLNSHGYTVSFADQPLLTMESLPYIVSVIQVMIANIIAVRDVFYVNPDYPLILGSQSDTTYVEANNIEINLLMTYELVLKMIDGFRVCGTFACGQDIRLP